MMKFNIPIHQIALMGDKEVGKTEFMYRFLTGKFIVMVKCYDPTEEYFDNLRIRLEGERSNGETCLINTHEAELPLVYSPMTTQIFRETQGALIVYSITSRASFEHVAEYAAWIRGVDLVDDNEEPRREPLPICLIGINSGSLGTREVEYAEGEQIIIKLRLQGKFREVSTRTGENIDKAFSDLLRQIRLSAYLAQLLKATAAENGGQVDSGKGNKKKLFTRLKRMFSGKD